MSKDATEKPVASDLPAGMSRFRVSLGEKRATVVAANESDAWALFCDANKSWPGPHTAGRKIEKV